MVVVKIELWPGGNELAKRSLGFAEITKQSGSTKLVGNYSVKLFEAGKQRRLWKTGVVEGFPRKRLGGWCLLYIALRNIIGDVV